jgi:hypothetical protein
VSRRALAVGVVIVALTAHAEPEPRHVLPPTNRAWHAILIGASGLALAGGYTAGAVLTGDQPTARPLAITGGVVTGGVLGASFGLLLGAMRDDPGSLVTYILRPVIGGLVGALVGGLLSGFGSWQPGTVRTVTHGVIIGLVISETVLLEIARLAR